MNTSTPLQERDVAEVMTTDLLTIAPTESVLMAWELLCQSGMRHLPVVDPTGRYLGVADAQTISNAWEPTTPYRARKPISSVLPSPVPAAIHPTDSVRHAAREMLCHGTEHVAVVDTTGKLVGLVTAHDLITALAGETKPHSPPHPSTPSLYRIEPVLPEPGVVGTS